MKQPRKIVQIAAARTASGYSELYALDEDGVAWRYYGTKDRPWDRLSALPEKDVADPVVMASADVELPAEPLMEPDVQSYMDYQEVLGGVIY